MDRLDANSAARKRFASLWRVGLPVREHLDRELIVDTKIRGGRANAVSVLTSDRCARIYQKRLRNACGRCCGVRRLGGGVRVNIEDPKRKVARAEFWASPDVGRVQIID